MAQLSTSIYSFSGTLFGLLPKSVCPKLHSLIPKQHFWLDYCLLGLFRLTGHKRVRMRARLTGLQLPHNFAQVGLPVVQQLISYFWNFASYSRQWEILRQTLKISFSGALRVNLKFHSLLAMLFSKSHKYPAPVFPHLYNRRITRPTLKVIGWVKQVIISQR